MNTSTDIRTALVIDKGPIWEAARILVDHTTLSEHLCGVENDWTVTVEHRPGDVPYELWGSGTQALWRLLCSMVYAGETVSLYEVFARLDQDNTRAAVNAITALGAYR